MNQERRDQARQFLHPGEQLVAACAYELGPGVPQPPESLIAPPAPSPLVRQIAERAPRSLRPLLEGGGVLDPRRSKPAAVADAIDRAPDLVDRLGTRLMHGKSMEGDWQSAAARFLIARASARGSATGVLAVTDRRWFGLSDVSPLWRMTPALEQCWEAPRSAVAALRANPTRVLQKGRMDIVFTDGSWVAVLATHRPHAALFAEAAARPR
ncbi:hypothetical protein ABZZ20_09695 [Streptomyces sp. NPDC006430]|uniref:hypothetical protein n=1 Tax=Streptomyces sp. NPDC006430 TaxID=3154299 RepID=UPI0033B5C3DD